MNRPANTVAALLAHAVALGLSCTGLWVDKGNEYPCDFSQPEGVRDQACTSGFVCSVSNVCRRYTNEGPQFEGPPPLPAFDAGEQLAPVLLHGRVQSVVPHAHDPDSVLVTVAQDGGEVFLVEGRGQARRVPLSLTSSPLALLTDGALVSRADGELWVQDLWGAGAQCAVQNQPTGNMGPPVARAGGYSELRLSVLYDLAANRAAEVLPRLGPGPGCARLRPLELTSVGRDGGVPLDEVIQDVRWMDRVVFEFRPDAGAERVVPVVLTPQALYYRAAAGPTPQADEWTRLNPDEDLGLWVHPSARSALVRHDPSGAAWVIASLLPESLDGGRAVFDGELRGLTVLRLTRTLGGGPRLSRAYNDCRPCAQGRILTFTPVLSSSGFSVEVLCEGPSPLYALTLTRVVDSFAADRTRPCQVEAVEPPIDLRELAFRLPPGPGERRAYAIDHSLGPVVVLGGRHGQLWYGTSLGRLTPLHLDRVPRVVGAAVLPLDAGWPLPPRLVPPSAFVPIALTDRYLAAPVSQNGLGALPLEDLAETALPAGATLSAAVGEASGWLLLSSGDFALVGGGDGARGLRIRFGPRLLDPQGEPAGPPHFAEAVTDESGAIVSVVAIANDSLYFVPGPLGATAQPNAQAVVTPQLTPEPSFPIRSMTLERSPLGTNGRTTARGYLVTSRNLYEFSLTGQPARWSARQIFLSVGEPVEVWMDHPKGGLGRVGFRDGAVFTLPGGFPLVQPLPRDRTPDGGGGDRVLDYGNLGGWPVALASSGLYVAGWGLLADGTVDRRFPDGGPGKTMTWRLVTLPDGSEPWRGPDGRVAQGLLEVSRLAPRVVDGKTHTPFLLRLWGPLGRVWEVGSVTRVTAR